MMGRRRSEFESSSSGSGLTTVRDVVEILAIVAAGVWAFYTFVYENQIKPANSQPVAQVESSLTRLGEKNGLIAVQSHLEIKNVGQAEIWLYGISETVLGSTVRRREPLATASPGGDRDYELTDDVGWTHSDPTRVSHSGSSRTSRIRAPTAAGTFASGTAYRSIASSTSPRDGSTNCRPSSACFSHRNASLNRFAWDRRTAS
jgi:hypothetical protein